MWTLVVVVVVDDVGSDEDCGSEEERSQVESLGLA